MWSGTAKAAAEGVHEGAGRCCTQEGPVHDEKDREEGRKGGTVKIDFHVYLCRNDHP